MEIHWLSILNSFVLVILLTGFIAIIILRVLKSDYSRYQREYDRLRAGQFIGAKWLATQKWQRKQ